MTAADTTASPETVGEVADKTEAVCVVGAGSSGLAAAKNLHEHGLDVEVLEREDDVGGNWYIDAATSRVYQSVRLISSKPFTQFPDFPMPDALPDYPNHAQIHRYLRRYAEHFGLRELITFGAEVERLEPIAGGAAWDVTVRRGGERRTARYGAVVIANGHNWHPKIPEYPGEFHGEAIHSAEYREPSVLAGKRVLVVGGGNTGCDLAVEAAQHAADTLHSTRRGYWYAPKYTFGRPSDQVYDLVLGLRLPRRVLQALFHATLRLTVGDLTRHGLPEPDHRFLETHPIVNSLLLYYVGHGAIRPKPDLARLDGDAVVFTDGSRERIDLILWCTGYLLRFEFIDRAHLNWDGDKPDLYKNVFTPAVDNLAVCGLIQPDSGQFKIVHWQAVAIAKVLRAVVDGDREALARFHAARARRLGEDDHRGLQYKESTRHHVEINHFDYLRGMERLVNEIEGSRPRRSVRDVLERA
jgi:thioredoxin reductase